MTILKFAIVALSLDFTQQFPNLDLPVSYCSFIPHLQACLKFETSPTGQESMPVCQQGPLFNRSTLRCDNIESTYLGQGISIHLETKE